MDLDEKLKYFYQTTVTGISHKGDVELNELNARLEGELEDYKTKAREDAKLEKTMRLEANARNARQELSSEKLKLRRELSKTEGQLLEELFTEVEEILGEYRKSPEYLEELTGQIKSALNMAEGGECRIYISPHDAELKETLEQRTGVSLLVSSYSIKGGIQAEIPDKNIFVDNSFSSRIDDIRAHYVLNAGAQAAVKK